VLTTAGGRLEHFALKDHRATLDPDSPPLELIATGQEPELPMGVELGEGTKPWSDDRIVYDTSSPDLHLSGDESATVELRAAGSTGSVIKRLTFHGDTYPIDLEIDLAASHPTPPRIALLWTKGLIPHVAQARVFEGAAALVGHKLVQTDVKSLDAGPKTIDGDIVWAGYEDQYFLSAVSPAAANTVVVAHHDATLKTRIVTEPVSPTVPVKYALYLGPKDLKILESADHEFIRAVNLGWFGAISMVLLRVLTVSHRVTNNYGIDIIVLTLLVKLAFWPLTQKSFKSMREMQKLQPQMAKIREKFKDDPKQMNTEIMELYRRHKLNPLGGCLPMVLQMPVFFGLYQTLANAIELRHAPFVFWVRDLSAPERLHMLGVGIPVLTILLGVSMFVQQRMSPPTGDPAQQRVMMFMPLIFTYMFIGFPAGLTLYWLTNNVLTIAQQYVVTRSVPT
jgi:YidC/Oxa1 family membrane protein insertase